MVPLWRGNSLSMPLSNVVVFNIFTFAYGIGICCLESVAGSSVIEACAFLMDFGINVGLLPKGCGGWIVVGVCWGVSKLISRS